MAVPRREVHTSRPAVQTCCFTCTWQGHFLNTADVMLWPVIFSYSISACFDHALGEYTPPSVCLSGSVLFLWSVPFCSTRSTPKWCLRCHAWLLAKLSFNLIDRWSKLLGLVSMRWLGKMLVVHAQAHCSGSFEILNTRKNPNPALDISHRFWDRSYPKAAARWSAFMAARSSPQEHKKSQSAFVSCGNVLLLVVATTS